MEQNQTNKRRKKRIITKEEAHSDDDDYKPPADEEEEEDEENNDLVDDDDDNDDEKEISKGQKQNTKSKSSSSSSPSKKSTAIEKQPRTVNNILKHKTTAASNSKKKSEMMATSIFSDEKLLENDNDDKQWKQGSPMPYAALCSVFEQIEAISGRLEIQKLLTNLFRKVLLKNPKDMYDLVYLASNSVAPAYECIELGVGDSILIKAIGEASGTNPAMVKQKYESEGDLGSVAKLVKGKQRTLCFGAKPKALLAKEILSVFRQIATTTGSQSQKWKVDKIKGLLVRAQGPEAKYVIRGLQGKLRIGLAQSTVLVSLAHAFFLSPPKELEALGEEAAEKIRSSSEDDYPEDSRKLSGSKVPLDAKLECSASIVKKAYSEVPSYDSILDAALSAPLVNMHIECTLRPGIPVSPMLAKPTKSVQEVLKRLNGLRFTCEFKYDGERAQVHMTPDGITKVFSRNLLNTSEKYPEVPAYVKESCASSGVKSFILDTEVVAFNRETKQFVPFQVLSTRKKTEESSDSAKVQVIVQAFDLMYLNGESLLDKTLAVRRDLMLKNFAPVDGKFQYATSLDLTEDGDTTAIAEFLDTAVKGQCEGLMVKTLDHNAAYEPSRRSLNWLKLKKDYLEGLGDSVDLVPLGAYFGKGKRTGVYGAYLLACYDVDTEEFQSVCKIGTGFSDEDLKALAESLNKHKIAEKSSQYIVSDSLECDVWFDAVQVWEVKAADLSKSSTHKGAIDKTGETGRGIGLRFPRYERLRDDKKPEQATTSDQILEMYYAQDSVVDDGGGGIDDDGI